MDTPTQKEALLSFYENLTWVQRDSDYYLNPIGLSRRDAIIEFFQAQPNGVIGDLGCGEGLIAIKLRGGNRRIIGCDLSPSRARMAVDNGIEALAADVLQLPYSDVFFDQVICTEVVEHVINPAAALSEILRVLRNGGRAILTVPLEEQLEQTLLDIPETVLASGCYYGIREQFHLKNSHLSSFTEESFQKLVEESGFHIEDITFTYDYVLKRPRLCKIVKKLYYTAARSDPSAKLSQFVESVIRPLIFASYQRQDTKHHIVVKARKPGPQNV